MVFFASLLLMLCYNQNATPLFELNRKHLKQMWQPEFWIKELLCVSTLYKFAFLIVEPTCFVLTLCIVQGTRPIQWNNLLIKENNISRVLLSVEWSKLVTVWPHCLHGLRQSRWGEINTTENPLGTLNFTNKWNILENKNKETIITTKVNLSLHLSSTSSSHTTHSMKHNYWLSYSYRTTTTWANNTIT